MLIGCSFKCGFKIQIWYAYIYQFQQGMEENLDLRNS